MRSLTVISISALIVCLLALAPVDAKPVKRATNGKNHPWTIKVKRESNVTSVDDSANATDINDPGSLTSETVNLITAMSTDSPSPSPSTSEASESLASEGSPPSTGSTFRTSEAANSTPAAVLTFTMPTLNSTASEAESNSTTTITTAPETTEGKVKFAIALILLIALFGILIFDCVCF
ncbi:hypothetical protein L596_010259 [Steinernema carpocapsae]|uniref:Uncharacterized protein n=1 Tax=Steinernema carpocapsae TaxID=34508 RepID=A0A4U5PIC5_STECR|nr:hypothetical protein L596_010259 [Steinernema carpocapsae]